MKHGQSFKTMAITINGTGTLTGISVGGLPDGIVDTDMIAADAVTAPKIGSKTFTSYAIIGDVKANDVDGGTFTEGAWYTRDLNTEIADPDGIVSISNNKFTLQAGTYFIEAHAPAYKVNRHMITLYRTSAPSQAHIAYGTSMYANNDNLVNTVSVLRARVTITQATDYEIRHQGDATNATYGFGLGANFGTTELYTVVQIYKEA